ncbi:MULTISPECIES: hypothetical protein [Pseudoalteromonas]|jgi:hypothetical protein|uniref:Uncharacterized protein n=1 Tax=Pseudoalteromonas aliena SW19 TaxID=1314866 RepID=A0ABR9E424_9GAMM|nr:MULTISPECIES: hypothetical protein [Pseudoalteromonas]MBB1387393.1 hypothetical protein [Pseudoalteromonas sp. SG45-5]MBB1395562.1 hypothetical protein [Pseudoalteromonas sp. SG44-4]MBB1449284.1 hypothetical protein [Pseudoalteromonas sp. SG41-6]MBE0361371.1 hypothetical protein [Pseudoalteromonas aliena SW19]
MELSVLAMIMLVIQPVFVYLYIKSVVRPSIFIAATVAMSVFYTNDFMHALLVFGGINLVGVLFVKLAERKGYTKFSPSYFFSGVICWFIIFGIISFISSLISLPSLDNVSESFDAFLSLPEPVAWPIITFFSASLVVLFVNATILLSLKNTSIAFKVLVVYAVISPLLPLFSNYFWLSQIVTFLAVINVLGTCEKYFFRTKIENDQAIALAYAGSLLLSCVIYLISAFFNLY